MTDLSRKTERELATLADGALSAKRRERVLARVRESEELRGELSDQQIAVELLSAVQARAPEGLHRDLEAMVEQAAPIRSQRSVRPRTALVTAAAVALVAVVAALGVFSGGGRSSGLSVERAASLALSPATRPAPTEN